MDYYRQITKSVDATSWMRIINEPGNPEVYLGARLDSGSFIVDGRVSGNDIQSTILNAANDTLADPLLDDYAIFYGGQGADTLTGGISSEMLLGGANNDILRGNGSADRLYGDTGTDTLYGGTGKDILTGGPGVDKFVFDTVASATNIDTITDFLSGTDKILLDDDIFTMLGITGTLAGVALTADKFHSGTSALDTLDRIVYNSSTGALYYDANGSVSGQNVQIALIGTSTHPMLAASDFLIIA